MNDKSRWFILNVAAGVFLGGFLLFLCLGTLLAAQQGRKRTGVLDWPAVWRYLFVYVGMIWFLSWRLLFG